MSKLLEDVSQTDLIRTVTQAERILPPDNDRPWALVSFAPMFIPGPNGQLACLCVCLWSAQRLPRVQS